MTEHFDLAPGRYRRTCPVCARGPKDMTVTLTVHSPDDAVSLCHRCGYTESHRAHRSLTPAERRAYGQQMRALRLQYEAQEREQHARAAAEAALRWARATPATSHPYLQAKAVKAHGIRIEGSDLLIPLRDTEGRLQSLQIITPAGGKRFMPGGLVKSGYHSMGSLDERLVICEGYATGATLHEQAEVAVAVAFNAGNLLPVARALRRRYPAVTIILAADDDWKTAGNPGLTAATEAAKAVGGLLAVPKFEGMPRGDTDSDFNDLQRLSSLVEAQG